MDETFVNSVTPYSVDPPDKRISRLSEDCGLIAGFTATTYHDRP
ncbi:hypothetical protein HMPREF3223_01217 [Cutibacterium avidum]|nr:hypothetical protein HMPREF3223_01217 [Cutibacterium avidum]